ncbi:DUF2256 domain-containing protein [Psychrobacter sp. APC 3279]|uniref:DUF2256 domain-containing protein n=1 Tax=Psychrobacter sp. APC 3279 TaxID=3035189 RepID=UPI0025B2C7AF|nr:DUF2256 domain-containing protein [Psychrobacter sp. APC 3279]MDN3442140.1 DUF2256 domain-containing protein [Psychrobacter sp. APC 3279]
MLQTVGEARLTPYLMVVNRLYQTNEKIMAHKKKNVRKKLCPVCEREFSWTKKLDKNWESMVYCSDQCRRVKKYEGLDHQKEDK